MLRWIGLDSVELRFEVQTCHVSVGMSFNWLSGQRFSLLTRHFALGDPWLLPCGNADSLFYWTKQCFAEWGRRSLDRPQEPSQVSDGQMDQSVSRGVKQDVQVQ